MKSSPAEIRDRLNKNPRFNVRVDPVREAYLKERQRQLRAVQAQYMALLVMGAEQDANPVQKQKLQKGLPRLLRQFRHTEDPVPVIRFIEKVMFSGWKPRDPQIREHVERLEKSL